MLSEAVDGRNKKENDNNFIYSIQIIYRNNNNKKTFDEKGYV